MAARYNTDSDASSSDYRYENEDQIDPELKCTICRDPFVSPMVGKKCGHTFCEFCITNWYERDSSCPTCRQTTGFVPVTTRVLLSQLDRLLVRCQLCNESNIERGNFTDHIEYRCPQKIVQCKAADLKCPWTGNREQHAQHSATCSLLLVRPVIEELRTEIDDLADQLTYLQQQSMSPIQVKKNFRKQNYDSNSEKERFEILKDDLRRTWTTEDCRSDCNFCKNNSQDFFTCQVCLRPAVREHILAHDYNGKVNDVICRRCFQKYGRKLHLFD